MVVVIFKTLKNEQFPLEANREMAIHDLRVEASRTHPDHPDPENIVLIFRGHLLRDDETVGNIMSQNGVDENLPQIVHLIIRSAQFQQQQQQQLHRPLGNQNLERDAVENPDEQANAGRIFVLNFDLNRLVTYGFGGFVLFLLFRQSSWGNIIMSGGAVIAFFVLRYIINNQTPNTRGHPGYILPFFYSFFPGYQVPDLRNTENTDQDHDHVD